MLERACVRAAQVGDRTLALLLAGRARAAVSSMPPGELLSVEQRALEGRMRRLEAEIAAAVRPSTPNRESLAPSREQQTPNR